MISKTRMLLALAAVAGLVAVPTALARASHTASTVVTVTAGKPSTFSFTLSTKTVKHGTVTFKVTNGDSTGLPHDFKVCSKPSASAAANSCAGKVTPSLGKGASATLTVTFAKPGTYEYLCTIPGHAAGGMKGLLKVT